MKIVLISFDGEMEDDLDLPLIEDDIEKTVIRNLGKFYVFKQMVHDAYGNKTIPAFFRMRYLDTSDMPG